MANTPNNRRGIEKCEVDECDRLIFARDWCKKHYDRFNNHGDPTKLLPRGSKPGSGPTGEEVFWSSVTRGGEDECWEWTGHVYQRPGRKGTGYGRFQTKGKSVLAHRFSYMLHAEEELKPYEPVHHKCGNTICVNPKHLQKTTTHANTAEMMERRWYLKRIAELEAQVAACTCG